MDHDVYRAAANRRGIEGDPEIGVVLAAVAAHQDPTISLREEVDGAGRQAGLESGHRIPKFDQHWAGESREIPLNTDRRFLAGTGKCTRPA